MEALRKKLNHTTQARVMLVGVPTELTKLLRSFETEATVVQTFVGGTTADFVMAFVQLSEQVAEAARWVTENTSGDVPVWLVYPKQTSKNYQCAFNRDTGWAALGEVGFEPVRMVAVNDDWSALRFRRTDFIKKMKRAPELALSPAGKSRTAANEKSSPPKSR